MAESVKFFRMHASYMRLDWRARPNFGVHNVVLSLNLACTRLACALCGVQASIDRKNTSGKLLHLVMSVYQIGKAREE